MTTIVDPTQPRHDAALTTTTTPAGGGTALVEAADQPTPPTILAGARWGWVSLEVVLYGVLGLLALLSRFYDLDTQALHHDESLHAYFSWLYYVGQGYRHDPLMHGPFLFHITALLYFLAGASDATARYGPALFSAATVLLPFLVRRELGRWGALLASLLLLTSPSFLYFGRFERHDVYSAFFTLLIFAALLRYLDSHRPAWFLTAAAAWGLLFTNKEDVFIVTVIFGSALAVAIFWRVSRRVVWLAGGLVVALALDAKVLPKLLGWSGLPKIPWENPTNDAVRAYVVGLLTHPLILIGLLLLAGFALLASSALARQAGEAGWVEGLFGEAEPGGPVAALHALLRDRRTLWAALAMALAIYIVFYTSFFTNIPGIFSGSFGAIGYWLGQQGVRRAEQPWYYYLLLMPQYDPLAVFVGGVGVLLTGWRLVTHRLFGWTEGPQPFARGFIAWWAVASVAIYSWAGEKMPWMDIHLVLPLLLLTAALLGGAIEWLLDAGTVRRVSFQHDWLAGGLILATAVAWFLGAARLSYGGGSGNAWWVLLAPALVIGAVTAGYAGRAGWPRAGRVALLALSGSLLLYHVHAGWALAYQHGDVPKDMLVYVQTSPDVTRVMREIDLLSTELTGGKDLRLLYDDNTSWPFQWYLRDYRNKQYFNCSPNAGCSLTEPPADDVAIVLVGNENLSAHPELTGLLSNYVPQQYSMRWHFPEDETYRTFAIAPELGPGWSVWKYPGQPHGLLDVVKSVVSSLVATTQPANQARLFRLLAYRDLWAPLGSYDFTIYIRKDLLPQYNAIRYR